MIAFSSQEVGLLRICISALAFLPLSLRYFKRIKRKDLVPLTVVGLCGTGIPSFLFPLAQTQISSSIAGVLNSLTPLFTLILGILFFKTVFSWSKVGGVLLGLLGAILLILYGESMDGAVNIYYSLFAVAATICYATSVNTVGTYLKELDPITTSACSFIIVGIPALLYLTTTDIVMIVQTHEHGWQSLLAVSVLGLVGTVISTIIFFQLVQLSNALFASTIAYVIPIVALAWGAFDGEPITIYHGIGMLLILMGVYLSRKQSITSISKT